MVKLFVQSNILQSNILREAKQVKQTPLYNADTELKLN